MTPPKKYPPLFIYFQPMTNTVLVLNLITNVKTIYIDVVIITDSQYQKMNLMHITIKRIKHRMNIFFLKISTQNMEIKYTGFISHTEQATKY